MEIIGADEAKRQTDERYNSLLEQCRTDIADQVHKSLQDAIQRCRRSFKITLMAPCYYFSVEAARAALSEAKSHLEDQKYKVDLTYLSAKGRHYKIQVSWT
jgi:ribosomal protein L7/L12